MKKKEIKSVEILLMKFLFYLNEKDLINNHDFDYKKETKKYIKIIK